MLCNLVNSTRPCVPSHSFRPLGAGSMLAKIRESEYSNVMPNQLRAYTASVFQALAHPTRIAIVETLRAGELSAGALQARLGIEQANLSQHLTILRSRHIVINRKGGNQAFDSLED